METYHVYTSIQFRFATTEITSVIHNTESSRRNIQFQLRLPQDAFITKFTMTAGTKTYTGEIKERTYGSQVSFSDQDISDVHATRDGNIFGVSLPVDGEERATYTIVYQERLHRHEGLFEHKLYLGLNRIVDNLFVETYIWENSDVTGVRCPAMRPLNRVHADYGQLTNDLAVINKLAASKVQVIYTPTTQQQGSSGLYHLYIVQYDVQHQPEGEIVIQDGYFMHFFAPDTTPLPKDIIFVIDKSGSMGWDNKMAQMIDAMLQIMGDVQPIDNFNIVPFDMSVYPWQHQLVPANYYYINQAKDYIRNMYSSGGTNIKDAIIAARNIFDRRSVTERVAMIFFLTDGQDRTPLSNDPTIPIYGLAFGDDADLDYIKTLCAVNGGFSQKIYTNIDAANQVKNFYEKISAVTMKRITFKYDPEIVDIASLTPTEFSLVVNGSELIVVGRLKKNVQNFKAELEIEGESGTQHKSKQIDDIKKAAPVSETAPSNFFTTNMEKSWAFETIKTLLKEDEKKATSKGDVETLEQALHLAVKYGFVTPLTSVVITDSEQNRQLTETAMSNQEEKRGDRMSEFIKSRPSTTTVSTTTTTTTTLRPKCKPNTTIEDAIKSEILSLTNASSIFETCLNVNPRASRYLYKAMDNLGKFTGMSKRMKSLKQNGTRTRSLRSVHIEHIVIHDKTTEHCIRPLHVLEPSTSYILMNCTTGPTIYLITGTNMQDKSASAERLMFVSNQNFATLYLGASTYWSLFGDLALKARTNESNEINLQTSCFNITLYRRLDKSKLELEMYIDLEHSSAEYGGIIAHHLKNTFAAEDNVDCFPFHDEHALLQIFKEQKNKLILFFLDNLFDLMKNFPLMLLE